VVKAADPGTHGNGAVVASGLSVCGLVPVLGVHRLDLSLLGWLFLRQNNPLRRVVQPRLNRKPTATDVPGLGLGLPANISCYIFENAVFFPVRPVVAAIFLGAIS